MSEVQNKAVGLGLVFGIFFGIVFGPMIFDDPSVGIGVGISFGLVFGAAFSQIKKGQHATEAPSDDAGDDSAN
jgi:hypothetical protein